jgi:hypothetical protein
MLTFSLAHSILDLFTNVLISETLLVNLLIFIIFVELFTNFLISETSLVTFMKMNYICQSQSSSNAAGAAAEGNGFIITVIIVI